MFQTIDILIVDDMPANLFALKTMLKDPAYNIVEATSGDEALKLIAKQEFALVLLDVQMPTMDGFETAAQIRKIENKATPLIFVTALDRDMKHVKRAYELGVVDYLTKPIDSEILLAKVSVFAHLYQIRKRSNELVTIQEVTTETLARSENFDDALSILLPSLAEALHWDIAAYWSFSEEKQSLTCAAFYPTEKSEFHDFRIESLQKTSTLKKGLAAKAVSQKKTIWIETITQDPDLPRLTTAIKKGLKSTVAFPIHFHHEIFGVIELFCKETQKEDKELTRILSSIGSQLGQFIKRTRAIKQTQLSEIRTSAILQTALDSIISMDHEGTVLEFNPAAEKTFGYKRQDVIGKLMADLIIPERYRHAHAARLKHYSNTGEGPVMNQRIEVTAQKSDGTEFDVELTIVKVPLSDPPMFTGFLRDITERQILEKERIQNTKHLQLLTDAIPHILWTADSEAKTNYYNKRWFDYNGSSPKNLLDHSMAVGTVHADDLSETARKWKEALQTKTVFEAEFRLRRNDGTYRWHLGRTVPALDENQNVLNWFGTSTDIHDQKTAQTELEQIFNLPTHLICIIGADGNFHKVNPAQKSVLGWDPEELVGEPVSKFIVPEDEEKTFAEMKKLFQGVPVITDFRNRCLHGDGGYRWISWSGAAKEGLIYCIGTDITQQLLAEDQIKESERRFRQIADTIPQFVWTADEKGSVTYFNKVWYQFTGCTSAETEKWGWQQVVHPEDREKVTKDYLTAVSKGVSFESQHRFLRANDHTYRWHLVRTLPLKNSDGTPYLWVGTATDIDDQKKLTESQSLLAKTTEVLSASLDYSITLQSVADLCVPAIADWCAIDVMEKRGPRSVAVAHPNPEMLKWWQTLIEKYPVDWSAKTGAPNVIRTGKSELYPFISDELLKASAKNSDHLALLTSMGMKSAIVVPFKVRDKTLGTLTLISTSREKVYTVEDMKFCEEIASRAAIAIENANLYEEAKRAIKLREEFLSIASHELRTPLTGLSLQLQMILRALKKTEAGVIDKDGLVKKLVSSTSQAKQLEMLIDSLLDVSRIGSGSIKVDKTKINLAELVHEVVSQFSAQAAATNDEIRLKQSPPIFGHWDSLRVTQAVTNLISNALKYGEGKPITVRIFSEKGFAGVSVIDQGMGIAVEDHNRIFDRFERAISHQNISGMGLGLFIANQIAQAHGGRIVVDSTPGQGSNFTLKLPIEDNEFSKSVKNNNEESAGVING